jgi:predicted deacylase
MTDKVTAADDDSATAQRHLRELIEALDRRVPHIERLGEVDIVEAANALRHKARQRLAALESDTDNRG